MCVKGLRVKSLGVRVCAVEGSGFTKVYGLRV